MTRPRLLLVEDDDSIRRFIGMALEDHGLEIVEAPLLASAIEALRGPPFALVMCDLMLPDGHGLDLLRALSGAGSPCPQARRVAFSAGVTAEMRVLLEQAGVHEVLTKPASLAALEACVVRALAVPAAGLPASAPDPVAPVTPVTPAAPAPAAGAPGPRAAHATHHFFGGDVALYQNFLAQCRPQFRRDAAAGDQAVELQDLPALLRLAHSVKSVLLTLGFDSDSLLAARLETAAANQQTEAAWGLWPALRVRLLAQYDPPDGPPDTGAPAGRG